MNPTELAETLAEQARVVRSAALAEMRRQDDGPFWRVCLELCSRMPRSEPVSNERRQDARIDDMNAVPAVADVVGQTAAYGMLVALWHLQTAQQDHHEAFSWRKAFGNVSVGCPLVRRIFAAMLKVGADVTRALDDLAELLQEYDLDTVFARDVATAARLPGDPVVHFYEHFLHAYDAKERKDRGVFYTPDSLVAFIVRSVDRVIKEEWKLEDGLASSAMTPTVLGASRGQRGEKDNREQGDVGITDLTDQFAVTILDPAAGTGTFLTHVIRTVHQHLCSSQWGRLDAETRRQKWQRYVRKCLLPRLYGYEVMPAAYAICHLNIAQTLIETGYEWKGDERVRLYLANALETGGETHCDADHERSTVSVVIGNPPYASLSAHLEPEHRAWVERYKYVHGERLRPRNALQFEKNINDDYVKFLALAEHCIRRSPMRVLGMVTNHSYVEGESHVGLRASLLSSFEQVRCLDLHGNVDKKETTPDGARDENVFAGVSTGTAVLVASHSASNVNACDMDSSAPAPTPTDAWCGDLWGTRDQKLSRLAAAEIHDVTTRSDVESPHYLFRQTDATARQFHEWPLMTELFPACSGATKTGFDELLLDFDRESLLEKIRAFANDPNDGLRIKAAKRAKGRARELADQPDRLDAEHAADYLGRIQFRPFDYRWCYLKKDCLKANAFRNMERLSTDAPGIATTSKSTAPFAAMAVSGFFAHKLVQAYDQSMVLPSDGMDRALLHYVVGLLHAPEYARRFAPSLRTSYPRIPLPPEGSLAKKIEQFGADIVALETLHFDYTFASWNQGEAESPLLQPQSEFSPGSFLVDPRKNRFDADEQRVYLSDRQWFGPVLPSVWKYRIGSYQVLANWLSQRKGRRLNADEQRDFVRATVAIKRLVDVIGELERCVEGFGG